MIELSTFKIVAFDLDDTLYKERDFLKSGIRHCVKVFAAHLHFEIVYQEENWVEFIVLHSDRDITKQDVLEEYRHHSPDIKLSPGVLSMFKKLKSQDVAIHLITDGRIITQNNKIDSLGIRPYLNSITISEELGSEKPNKANFLKSHSLKSAYIGDNPKKDFITPNSLGWVTIMIADNGENIHNQNIELRNIQKPQFVLRSIKELNEYI